MLPIAGAAVQGCALVGYDLQPIGGEHPIDDPEVVAYSDDGVDSGMDGGGPDTPIAGWDANVNQLPAAVDGGDGDGVVGPAPSPDPKNGTTMDPDAGGDQPDASNGPRDAALPDGMIRDAATPDAATPDAATGDAAVPDASTPDAGPVPTVGVAACGPLVCDLVGGEACCVVGQPSPPSTVGDSAYSCVTGVTSCNVNYECDGDPDCSGGEVCCCVRSFSGDAIDYTCRGETSCALAVGIRLACTRGADCPGQFCCAEFTDATISRDYYNETYCADACPGSTRTFCAGDADCPTGQTCRPSTYMPGTGLCG